MPSVSAEEAPKLKPYMKLAEQIGSFAGQVTESSIEAVSITYEGAVAELNTKPLTAVVLQGLLTPLLEAVNMVSAPAIAKERGMDVTEITHERKGAYQSLIRLEVTTEAQTRSISGTLFNGDNPRIVEIKGIAMDAQMGPHMLFVTNHDKAGFIGALGTALGDAGINIATFNLGRTDAGGDAIVLIEVDGAVPDEVLDSVNKLPNVVRAKALTF